MLGLLLVDLGAISKLCTLIPITGCRSEEMKQDSMDPSALALNSTYETCRVVANPGVSAVGSGWVCVPLHEIALTDYLLTSITAFLLYTNLYSVYSLPS